MIFNRENPYVINRIDTQVTHPFFYTTRMGNKKNIKKTFSKTFNLFFNKKEYIKNNKKNIFFFLFSNQTLTLGCVTCVWIMGGFIL